MKKIEEMDARTAAITLLHCAGTAVARSGEPGSAMCLDTLHNAVHYLITGRLPAPRGIANLWARWEAEPARPVCARCGTAAEEINRLNELHPEAAGEPCCLAQSDSLELAYAEVR